ncbi:MAG: CinA family protein [Dehalococcoidia bacterium]|nr:CinA family protein [Dehalococcoidia bacterium]
MSEQTQNIVDMLRNKGLTLGVAESATGGLVSHLFTNVPGSSDVYKGSVTAYANQTKIAVLGVKPETLQQYGAVSPQVAEEMAKGCCCVLNADICVSDTGIAGPGGATPDKPLGLFYMGLAHQTTVCSQKHIFQGDREENKKLAAQVIFDWLEAYLQNLE